MIIGVFYAILAAVLLGFYALPSKFIKGYEIENTWGVFWALAMFVVPITATFLFVDGLHETYSQVSGGVFLAIIVLALLWGVGNLMWGIAISRIGMALGFSLLIGVTTFVGSVLPFLMGHFENMLTTGGLVIAAGIVVIMVGIAANGKAGLLRESHEQDLKTGTATISKNMGVGILMCIVGGLCAAGFNLSYHVADNIGHIGSISQSQFHNPPWIARLAVMLPCFIGSGVATFAYFVIRISRQRSWMNYSTRQTLPNFCLLAMMAVVYCTSLIIYGLAAYHLGSLGTSVGFAIFQTGCIMVANLLGLLTGEWKNAGSSSHQWLAGGLATMCVGIVIVAIGNSLII